MRVGLKAAALCGVAVVTLSHCGGEMPTAATKEQQTSAASVLPGGRRTSLPTPQQVAPTAPNPPITATAPPPAATAAPILPQVPKRIEGAVVENLGPCHGRGIAGSATIKGRTEYVCGDGSRDYGYDTGYYGSHEYGEQRYGSGNRGYGSNGYGYNSSGYNNSSRYQSRNRRYTTYPY